MNRVILIGNGFDLAHGLKTSYADFINWYWAKWGYRLLHGIGKTEKDRLCSFVLNDSIDTGKWSYVWQGFYYKRDNPFDPWDEHQVVGLAKQNHDLCTFSITSPFFKEVCHDVESKGWVDIENMYYTFLGMDQNNTRNLNDDLDYVRERLIEYLDTVQKSINTDTIVDATIRNKMFSPIKKQDVAVGSENCWQEMIEQHLSYSSETWQEIASTYGVSYTDYLNIEHLLHDAPETIRQIGIENIHSTYIPDAFYLPDNILFLNFNYTNTADLYIDKVKRLSANHIHGELANPNSVVFGYGDELDENYKNIVNKNDNEYLRNIKSIRYQETPNYRNLHEFIESSPYQIYIMGHSCGNSDRTLLNTLFEHRNCVSIKPFYHVFDDGHDNYMELVQNISRNFTDMRLMRDRVVNKTFCETI